MQLSLGRISAMIQQLVIDDYFRYHKTLLIWTNKYQGSAKEEVKKQDINKLTKVKEVIKETLRKNKDGISLA